MTPAEIPAPAEGWVLACKCGLPVKLGNGNFQTATIAALEHLRVCPLHKLHATVAVAIAELVQTVLWSQPDHYQRYRNLLYAAQQNAYRQGAPRVQQRGCGACGG